MQERKEISRKRGFKRPGWAQQRLSFCTDFSNGLATTDSNPFLNHSPRRAGSSRGPSTQQQLRREAAPAHQMTCQNQELGPLCLSAGPQRVQEPPGPTAHTWEALFPSAQNHDSTAAPAASIDLPSPLQPNLVTPPRKRTMTRGGWSFPANASALTHYVCDPWTHPFTIPRVQFPHRKKTRNDF